MSFGLKRLDLQSLAQSKLDDALLLLSNKRFSNAYYLAGYSVELGLKSCIARQIAAEAIPDKALINDTYQHNLKNLVRVAGLSLELKKQEQRDSAFAANWALVAEWTPESRYGPVDPLSAQYMIEAIGNSGTGILQWIKAYW